MRRLKLVELVAAGLMERCGAAFGQFEPYPLWGERFLANRLRCYRQTDHRLADTAREELEAFYARQPRSLREAGGGAPATGPEPSE